MRLSAAYVVDNDELLDEMAHLLTRKVVYTEITLSLFKMVLGGQERLNSMGKECDDEAGSNSIEHLDCVGLCHK